MNPLQGNNPALMVDEDARQAHFNSIRGNPESTLQQSSNDLDAAMKKAIEQAGDSFDLSKVDSIGGTTVQEKAESLVKMHSELAATTDALIERKRMEKVADSIRKGNRPGAAFEVDSETNAGDGNANANDIAAALAREMVAGNPSRIHDEVQRIISETGGDLGKASSNPIGIEIDLGERGVMNTLFQTTDGWPPFVNRQPGWVPDAQRPVQVLDLIPTINTTENAIKYMEETVFSNAAVEVAEAAAAPEAELELTERTENIRKIAVHIPVTEEQLEDVPQVEMYLNNRLPFMVRQRLDGQVINGDGTGVNLSGILDRAGILNEEQDGTAAAPTKPLNSLLKAKTKVNFVGFAMANAYAINPNYWDQIALAETTAGGFYLGNPQNAFMPRIWGLPVAMANVLADGNADDEIPAFVGDFMNFAYLGVRRDMLIEFGVSNDDFLKGILRIKATCRTALAVTRPAAFCKVTMNIA